MWIWMWNQRPQTMDHGPDHRLDTLTSPDVILSTFRPALKTVTAEDIASSLYYVHSELPAVSAGSSGPRQQQQQQFRPQPQHQPSNYASPPLSDLPTSKTNSIRRKPVPNITPIGNTLSQLDVHPLLRTPALEDLDQAPGSTSMYTIPQTHASQGLAANGNGQTPPTHHDENALHIHSTVLQNRSAVEPRYQVFSPAPLAPQQSDSPEAPSPSRTVSRASEHPALPSSRRILARSMPERLSSGQTSFALNSSSNHDAIFFTQPGAHFSANDNHVQQPATPDSRPPPPAYSPLRTAQAPLDAKSIRTLHEPSSPALSVNSDATHGRPSPDAQVGHLTPPSTVATRTPSPTTSPQPPAFATPPGPSHFTLTLIRREPSSSNQWNVGRITALVPSDLDPEHPEDASSLLHIHVDTAGYAKFARAVSGQPSAPISSQKNNTTPHLSPSPRTPTVAAFQREVRASYGKRWTSNIRDLFRRSHSGTPSPSMHARHDSAGSTGSLDPDGHDRHSGKNTKLRGFEFDSPWGGRCEFRTAEGGRNLRCQHHLPPDVLAGQNGQPSRDPVSELRLNLPRYHSSASDQADQAVHGHFSKFIRRSDHDEVINDGWDEGGDDNDDDGAGLGVVSPFELNLGREKAGGGHRGKRAKMGKLIVYDAGLKMLDLVVAANIGLWWRLWDVRG